MMLEKQQLESEVLGLHAELQQMQVLSANQQSELKNLQLIVAGKLCVYSIIYCFVFYIFMHYFVDWCINKSESKLICPFFHSFLEPSVE